MATGDQYRWMLVFRSPIWRTSCSQILCLRGDVIRLWPHYTFRVTFSSKVLILFCLCQTLLFFFLQICYAINLGKEIIEVQKVRFILVLAEQLKRYLYTYLSKRKAMLTRQGGHIWDFLLSLLCARHFWSPSSCHWKHVALLTNTTATALVG